MIFSNDLYIFNVIPRTNYYFLKIPLKDMYMFVWGNMMDRFIYGESSFVLNFENFKFIPTAFREVVVSVINIIQVLGLARPCDTTSEQASSVTRRQGACTKSRCKVTLCPNYNPSPNILIPCSSNIPHMNFPTFPHRQCSISSNEVQF